MNGYINNKSTFQVVFMLLLVLGSIGLADLDLGNGIVFYNGYNY
jgi:hypothetical protein